MNLRDQIQQDINEALKKKEKQRLDCLRFLWSQIQNKEIEKGRKKLSDEEVIKLINSLIKKSEESLTFFKKRKRKDLIEETETERKILKSYLPKQLSNEELEKEVKKIINQNPSISQPGPLIGICIKALAGQADNKRIAQAVIKVLK